MAQTCGQCHPGVTDKFAASKVHVDAPLSADIGSKAVRWIRKFYLGMIFAVIGGMLLHNFILWRSKVIALRKAANYIRHAHAAALPNSARRFADEFLPAGSYRLRAQVP